MNALLDENVKITFVNEVKNFSGTSYEIRENGQLVSSSRLFTDGAYETKGPYYKNGKSYLDLRVAKANYVLQVNRNSDGDARFILYLRRYYIPRSFIAEVKGGITPEESEFIIRKIRDRANKEAAESIPTAIKRIFFKNQLDIFRVKNFLEKSAKCTNVDSILISLQKEEQRKILLAKIGIVLKDAKEQEVVSDFITDELERRRDIEEQFLHSFPLKAAMDADDIYDEEKTKKAG